MLAFGYSSCIMIYMTTTCVYTKWEDLPEVDRLKGYYSDYHKELYGFRPPLAGLTVEDLKAEIAALDAAAPAIWDEEKAREEAAINSFLQRVESIKAAGAGDFETAVRWMMDAEDDPYCTADPGYFEYLYGLPYGFLVHGPRWIAS